MGWASRRSLVVSLVRIHTPSLLLHFSGIRFASAKRLTTND